MSAAARRSCCTWVSRNNWRFSPIWFTATKLAPATTIMPTAMPTIISTSDRPRERRVDSFLGGMGLTRGIVELR